jgi:hypothetical protein
LDAVQQVGGHHPVDYDGTFFLDDLGYDRGASVGGKMFDGHSSPPHLLSSLTGG